jgi:hypothetical protein
MNVHHTFNNTTDESYPFLVDDKLIGFVDKVFLYTDEIIQNSLISYLTCKENLIIDLLNHKPHWILKLNYDAEDIRKFWNTQIHRASNCLSIYVCLLRNNLIPKDQISEANETIFKHNKGAYPESLEEHLILEKVGFGDAVHKVCFIDNKFSSYNWVNSRAK